MSSDFNARLARFGPRDVTVIATNGLLRVLPHAEPLPPVQSMAEVVAAMTGGAQPAVVQRAEQLVGEQNARRALLLATGLDAGDGIITVFSSIRSAIALYMGRHGGSTPPTGWSDHQAGDAVLKAIALGHLLDLCFPDSEDPVTDLAWLPAGRALLAYYAAAELALPFVEVVVDGEHTLSIMLPEHADAQARKLATVVGSAAVQGSAADLIKQAMLRIDRALTPSSGAALPNAQSGRLLLQIHDELIFEVEEARATALRDLVREAMQEPPRWGDQVLSVPLLVQLLQKCVRIGWLSPWMKRLNCKSTKRCSPIFSRMRPPSLRLAGPAHSSQTKFRLNLCLRIDRKSAGAPPPA